MGRPGAAVILWANISRKNLELYQKFKSVIDIDFILLYAIDSWQPTSEFASDGSFFKVQIADLIAWSFW